jgi:hypothetical protein
MKKRKRSSRAYRRTPQVMAHSEEQARRWLTEGLKAAGLVAKDLPGMKGSDPRKLALAELLWKRTTISQEWIAENLSMRSAANVSLCSCAGSFDMNKKLTHHFLEVLYSHEHYRGYRAGG